MSQVRKYFLGYDLQKIGAAESTSYLGCSFVGNGAQQVLVKCIAKQFSISFKYGINFIEQSG